MKKNIQKSPLHAFSAWNLDIVEKDLSLRQMRSHPLLTEWLKNKYSGTAEEKKLIEKQREILAENVIFWNEDELKFKFLGPLMQIVNFDEDQRFRAFTQRKLEAIVQTAKGETIRIGGTVDFMIATGRVNPREPFFFLHEYKKERGSSDDPLAQVIVEMLAARTLNGDDAPMYGCYIVGRNWFFVVLEGRNYAVSDAFVATQDDIFQIVAILQATKRYVKARVDAMQN